MPTETFHRLPEEKRLRIIELAIEEFSTHGFVAASITRLVSRAGIAKGSFYQYFKDKADLYEWILYDVVGRRKRESLQGLTIPEHADFWTTWGLLVMGGIRFGLENPRLSRLSADVWHPSSDPDLRRIQERFTRMARASTASIVERGIAEGHLRADLDLELATEFLLGIMQQGLDLAIQRMIGVDLIEYCSHPELAHRLPEAEQRRLIEGFVSLCRRALSSEKPPAPSEGPAIRILDKPWRPEAS